MYCAVLYVFASGSLMHSHEYFSDAFTFNAKYLNEAKEALVKAYLDNKKQHVIVVVHGVFKL